MVAFCRPIEKHPLAVVTHRRCPDITSSGEARCSAKTSMHTANTVSITASIAMGQPCTRPQPRTRARAARRPETKAPSRNQPSTHPRSPMAARSPVPSDSPTRVVVAVRLDTARPHATNATTLV